MRKRVSDTEHGASAGKTAARARRSWKSSAATIAFLLVLVAGGSLASNAFAASQGGAGGDSRTDADLVAHVTDADGATYDLPLSGSDELVVRSSAGVNVVRVEEGAVLVAEADCPNQDCVCQGSISSAGQQIVCLPNKLVVSVEWRAHSASADGVVDERANDGGSDASADVFDIMGS